MDNILIKDLLDYYLENLNILVTGWFQKNRNE